MKYRAIGMAGAVWTVAFSAAAFAASAAGPEPAQGGLKRWAVLADPRLRDTHVSDLVTASLSASQGLELVERERLNAITDEQQMTALSADPRARVALGKVLRADALVILRGPIERGPRKQKVVTLVLADSLQGARLRSDELPLDPDRPDALARSIVDAVTQTRRRFAGGVRYVVAVPHFVSKDLSHRHDQLQSTLARLAEAGFLAAPGVAVVETEDVDALRRETDLAPDTVRRVVPLLVAGEYETILPQGTRQGSPEDALEITLTVTVSDGAKTLKTLRRDCPSFMDAAEWLSGQLPAGLLGDALPKFKPLSLDEQFTALVGRADRFAAVGAYEESGGLREAALLLNQQSVEQRLAAMKDYQSLFNDLRQSFSGFDSIENLPAAQRERWQEARHAEWLRYFGHFEWLIRNRKIGLKEAAPLVDVPPRLLVGLDTEVRIFFRSVYPLLLESTASEPEEQRVLQHYGWASAMFVRIASDDWIQNKDDLDFILEIVSRSVPADTPPPDNLIHLAQYHQLYIPEGSPRTWPTEAQFARFYQALQRQTDKPGFALMGRYGLLCQKRANVNLATEQMKQEAADIEREVAAGLPPRLAQRVGQRLITFDNFHGLALREFVRYSTARGPAPRTEEVGTVSFDTIPVRVRSVSGEEVPFSQERRTSPGYPEGLRIKRCGGPKEAVGDVVFGPAAVLLHDGEGLLREILTDEAAGLDDVAWDGLHLWVASRRKGLVVLEPSGRVVTTVGEKDGLPPADLRLLLLPLGRNKVFATGAFGEQGRGWCATVELPGDSTAPARVQVLLKGTHIAKHDDAGNIALGSLQDPECVFVPRGVVGAPSAQGAGRSVWVSDFQFRLLRVELPAGTVSVFRPPAVGVSRGDELVWFGPGEVVASDGRAIFDVNLAQRLVNADDVRGYVVAGRLICDAKGKLVPSGGQWYVAGESWVQIDPATRIPHRLGPGITGAPFDLQYFDSAAMGLAAFDPDQGILYRISADPQRPLARHGVRQIMPEPSSKPLIQHSNGAITRFRVGRSSVLFAPDARREMTAAWVHDNDRGSEESGVVMRLRRFPEERRRVGVSDEQFHKLDDALQTYTSKLTALRKPDRAHLLELFQNYNQASEGEKQKAAEPLFDECRRLGREWDQTTDDFVRVVPSILTPDQWKLLTYQ